MPVPASAVGRKTDGPRTTYIDARWVMSYAAGIGKGDLQSCYMDSSRLGHKASLLPTNDFHMDGPQGGGILTHPVFAWAVEWPILWKGMGRLFSPDKSLEEVESAVCKLFSHCCYKRHTGGISSWRERSARSLQVVMTPPPPSVS
jgi:hypothetical protein